MTVPYYEDDAVRLFVGDAREVLRTLPDESVQCCVTSPPYWGLRDYGADGQMGLEPTPEAYVAGMVGVFGEVRRVLRDDGTLWLNLGDSYAGSWGAQSRGGPPSESSTLRGNCHVGGGPKIKSLSATQIAAHPKLTKTGSIDRTPGLKPKDLVGIPWRVAFALQADGWWLRSDIIWNKPNPMPESVTDRPTKAHEYLFLLSKGERYYYDADAVAEDAVSASVWKFTDGGRDKQRGHGRRHAGFNGRYAERLAEDGPPDTRNRRSVWTIATKPYPEAHFATFPPELPRLCIQAGTKPGGTVLDPFAGAGTTLYVAKELGRKSVGIELNPTYADLICRRVAQHVLDLESTR
jgi:DNA modification methylase